VVGAPFIYSLCRRVVNAAEQCIFKALDFV